MIKAGIIGATGYAGAELVRILSGHPDVEISVITSRQHADSKFSEIYPAMYGIVDMVCETYSIDNFFKKVDIAFTALPHQLPMTIIPELLNKGLKVIDLSADFRFDNVATYEAFYQPHAAKELCKKAVYGLCEVNREKLKDAVLVANPGCYPTSVLLPLVPLIKNNLINTDFIIADSKSGASGAGRTVSLATQFCEVNESFKAYKVASHRHTPEMEEVLSKAAGKPVCLTFVPHLVPVTRGMLTTIYIHSLKNVNENEIRECLIDYYSKCRFVRVFPENILPDISYVKGTNFCDIGVKLEERTGRLILISAIDNLVKGAAGQAVQNMNIMMGLAETKGLNHSPFPV
jgi:N-acetyl-gamma-glutamyl-phosphate reductase